MDLDKIAALSGSGVAAAMIIFVLTFIVIPADTTAQSDINNVKLSLSEHESLPAHTEANTILDIFIDQYSTDRVDNKKFQDDVRNQLQDIQIRLTKLEP